jgi:hypothetical protein
LTYPSEKYEFVNGKDDIPYMKWKIKNVPNNQPNIYIYILIGGFNRLEKYEFVNGKDDTPYMKWNIKHV